MGTRATKRTPVEFPQRGVPGGWIDRWDAPDLDTAVLRLAAEQLRREQDAAVARVRRSLRNDG